MRLAALLLALTLPAAAQERWLGTWTAAAMPVSTSQKLPIGKQDVTLRQIVHISQGGKRLRITFTNEFGTTPLHIAAAHVAFLSAGSKILPATDRALTFAGKPDITIAPGQFAASDAVVETVPIFSDLVISTAIPQQDLPVLTAHSLALQTTFLAAGDQTTALEFDPAAAVPPGVGPPDVTAPIQSPAGTRPIVKSEAHPAAAAGDAPALLARTTSWYFLKDVEVDAAKKSGAIVMLGDSITDGAQSTTETNRRYPDDLAPLLAANKKTAALSVLNVGISGNRILHVNAGPSALDRFDRDVLGQTGARFVVLLEGINDIGNMHRAPADAMTEQELTDAVTSMANRAHAKGLKFFVATILPYGGAKYYSPDGETIRQHVNAFLRSSPLFDGVIDFDKAMQDPENPEQLLKKYECGDHLHPNDAGYAAMAAAVDLKLFSKKK